MYIGNKVINYAIIYMGDDKMDKELKEFIEFRNNYKFKQLDIVENNDNLYCSGELLKDENGYISDSTKWINIGYTLHNNYSKLLSNLFPYNFTFYNCEFGSIEGFFQGIKYKDINLQKQVFKYSGKDAVALKDATDYDWTITGNIYFLGKEIKRDSKEYDDLINELYISAMQNKLYRTALKKCPLPIIHPIGKTSKKETTFTRYEFELMLNCLHDFLNR